MSAYVPRHTVEHIRADGRVPVPVRTVAPLGHFPLPTAYEGRRRRSIWTRRRPTPEKAETK